MTLEDLPKHLREIALTDRAVAADVIDAIISHEDRQAGCVGLMICDDQDRALVPVVVSDVPNDANIGPFSDWLVKLLPIVADSGGSVLLGRGRPRGAVPTDVDRAWHQQMIDLCATHGVRLLGFYLATREGVFPLPDPLVAAS